MSIHSFKKLHNVNYLFIDTFWVLCAERLSEFCSKLLSFLPERVTFCAWTSVSEGPEPQKVLISYQIKDSCCLFMLFFESTTTD